jgi:hypothetical protein
MWNGRLGRERQSPSNIANQRDSLVFSPRRPKIQAITRSTPSHQRIHHPKSKTVMKNFRFNAQLALID